MIFSNHALPNLLNDTNKLDWSLSKEYACRDDMPARYEKIDAVLKEVDVIWIQRGSSHLRSIFEVEHSTPIYSGLLRFNDLHLVEPNLKLEYRNYKQI